MPIATSPSFSVFCHTTAYLYHIIVKEHFVRIHYVQANSAPLTTGLTRLVYRAIFHYLLELESTTSLQIVLPLNFV